MTTKWRRSSADGLNGQHGHSYIDYETPMVYELIVAAN
ncbi:MAG: hypothetical protein ACI8TX_000742 [Hyphomicrobiaceae bacterium]|jgi:hypothetical protein